MTNYATIYMSAHISLWYVSDTSGKITKKEIAVLNGTSSPPHFVVVVSI